MMEQKKENPDVKLSEPGREVMSRIPAMIIRSGIGIVFIIIFVLLIGSWFFKYPDVIHSSIVLTAENPPATIFARSDGKLEALLVEDNDKVEKGEWLGVIENTANYEDIRQVSAKLSVYKKMLQDPAMVLSENLLVNLSLGEVQINYLDFYNYYSELRLFLDFDYYSQKKKALKNEMLVHRQYYNQLNDQKSILQKDLELCRDDFRRDSVLYSKGSISKTEYEKRYSSYLGKQFDFESFHLDMSKEKILLLQLEQKLLDLQLAAEERSAEVRLKASESLEKLILALNNWEQKYVLKSPVHGIVTFSKIWNVNHNVRAGEKVVTVVPENPMKIIGRMKLPVKGSGKVKPGLVVNISFFSYPRSEYGIVKGRIEQISPVPDESFYYVDVSIQEELKTSYDKYLEYYPEMEGDAEIITEDIRLIFRILRPLKALFKNN
jgi:HlyD family secretion protein